MSFGPIPTPLSNAAPQPTGTAAAGTGTSVSRDDHIHALPSVGTAGTYAHPSSLTSDAQGRLTSVTAGSAPPSLPLSIANGGTGSATGDLVATNFLETPTLRSPSGSSLVVNANVAAGSVALQSNGVTALTVSSTLATFNTAQTLSAGTGTLTLNGTTGVALQHNSVATANTISSGLSIPTGMRLTSNFVQAQTGQTLSLTGNTALALSSNDSNSNITYTANATDGAAAIAHDFRNLNALANAAARHIRVRGNLTEVFAVMGSGATLTPSVGPSATQQHTLPAVTSDTVALLNAAQSLASKTLPSPVLSGTVTGTFTIGGTPTLGSNLAAGSNKITGLATATASGDALSYPWVTATVSSASLAASPFSLDAANGTYQDIGLSIALPSAGTYLVWYEIHSTLTVTTGANAYISAKLQNSTDVVDIANSERIGAFAGIVAQVFHSQIACINLITVAATKTLKVLCSRNDGTVYNNSDILDNADGRSQIGYAKLSP